MLHMNHYHDFDEAVQLWHKRKNKINWYNLCVVMYTDNPEILEQFDKLPYCKKICFVNFKTDVDAAFYLPSYINEGKPLWDQANHFAWGQPFYYDVFDMLLCGKKTPLIDM